MVSAIMRPDTVESSYSLVLDGVHDRGIGRDDRGLVQADVAGFRGPVRHEFAFGKIGACGQAGFDPALDEIFGEVSGFPVALVALGSGAAGSGVFLAGLDRCGVRV
jgi:hypothetical protein